MSHTSKPPFSLKPPAPRAKEADRLGALETLEAWTEKREEGGEVAAAERPPEVAALPSAAAAPIAAAAPSGARKTRLASTAIPASTPDRPVWLTEEKGRTQLNYRVDVQLYNKMKFLAGTTMGMDMTKLMNEILEPEVDRRLRERGYDV